MSDELDIPKIRKEAELKLAEIKANLPKTEKPYTDLESKIMFTLGSASMCWNPLPRGIFQDQDCAKLGTELASYIREHPLDNEGATLLDLAWGLISNCSTGWDHEGEWAETAKKWRDRYHEWLSVDIKKWN